MHEKIGSVVCRSQSVSNPSHKILRRDIIHEALINRHDWALTTLGMGPDRDGGVYAESEKLHGHSQWQRNFTYHCVRRDCWASVF